MNTATSKLHITGAALTVAAASVVSLASPAGASTPASARPALAHPTTATAYVSTATTTTLPYTDIRARQRRLASLGYYVGAADGKAGPLLSQATMALQKAAGLSRDGVYGPITAKALARGVKPAINYSGTGAVVDLHKQLLVFFRNGKQVSIINTSTGKLSTPTVVGSFSIYRSVNGNDYAPLGVLYRPRYFYRGYAIHGSSSIPGYAASHGCARVSNGAMNFIWSRNLLPMGGRVIVRH